MARMAKLELDTAAYFARLSPQALAEERQLEAVLAQAADEIDFDTDALGPEKPPR